jgi:hypothetical protein
MILKPSTWLVVALAGGALLAGCGSSSKSTSTSTAGATTPGPSTQATTPLTPAQAQQAVSTCKHGVQSAAAIPASARPTLEKTCEKAASGDLSALRQVAQEACIDLISASHIPAGSARERATALCKVNTTVGK